MAGRQASVDRERGPVGPVRWAKISTSLGEMLLAASRKGVCRLSFIAGAPHIGPHEFGLQELARHHPAALLEPGAEALAGLAARVAQVVEQPVAPDPSPDSGEDRGGHRGGPPSAAIALDLQGTPFQTRVWAALQDIPAGKTTTYGALALAIGQPGAARAVGRALAANPVAVLVPCHRVVGADGSPGGYAWGAAIKAALLRREREGADQSVFKPGAAPGDLECDQKTTAQSLPKAR